MPKPISEQLADLSVRAKDAEDTYATTKTAGIEKIQKREDEIQAAANRRAEESRQQYLKAQESMASMWSGLSNKVKSDVENVRANIDVKKQEHDRDRAIKRADQAEENAMMAIDFAYGAIDYAETAVLDAVLAREKVAAS